MVEVPDFIRKAAEERVEEPTPQDKLEQVRRLAGRLRDLYLQQSSLTDSLAEVAAGINLLETKELLDIMVEAKMPSFALDADGNQPDAGFKRTQIVNASIPEEKMSQALVWLEENDQGHLPKHEFKISFNMGENKEAAKFEALLKKNKVQYSSKMSVLAASLTAFVKRELAANRVVPTDILGVYVGEKVDVTIGGVKVKKVTKDKKRKS